MRAVVITRPGDLDSLEVRQVTTPEPSGDRIRVKVHAAGLNRADLLQAQGKYPSPAGVPEDIPGIEFAGEVDAIGPDAIGPWKRGDQVFGLIGGGGFAEYVVTTGRQLAPIPGNLDDESAAAVPEAFITAQDALEIQGQVRPGDDVLIHAVGGGVGSAAVQIAHAMGCRVFGTSRTIAKLEKVKRLGLDVAIDTSTEDFARIVLDATQNRGVSAVIDFLGASALASNLSALAIRGRLVLVGQLGGSAASLDLRTLMSRRITVVGTTLRARSLEEKILATRRFADSVVPWLERGIVQPVVDQVYPLEEIKLATERMSSNLGFGKVILRL